MEINEVITSLKDKFGDKINVEKVKEKLHGVDLSKLKFSEIEEKVKGSIGDLDGDGVVESPFAEIKGKATKMFDGVFHHHKA